MEEYHARLELTAKDQEIKRLEAELAECREENIELHNETDFNAEKFRELKAELAEARKETKEWKDGRNEYREDILELQAQLDEAKNSIHWVTAQKAREELLDREAQVKRLEKELANEKTLVEMYKSGASIQILQKEVEQLTKENARLRNG